MPPFSIEELAIRWPRPLLHRELQREIESQLDGWEERCSTILRDAFTTPSLAQQFEKLPLPSPLSDGFDEIHTIAATRFLEHVTAHIDDFPEAAVHKILFSKRKGSTVRDSALTLTETINRFERLVDDLKARGYFDELFGDNCPDSFHMELNPQDVLADRFSVTGIWPIGSTASLKQSLDPFLDLIEALDDLVQAPVTRYWHSFGEPHWDNTDTSKRRGQEIYRWEVNNILKESPVPYTLVTHGPDAGLLAESLEPDFTDLANEFTNIDNPDLKDRIDTAMAAFRKRNGGRESKKSACVTLAGVLEERRGILKDNLDKSSEGDLFKIANRFALRHRRENQYDDYGSEFLDWIFWSYMAAVSLTEKLISRDSPTS